MDKREDKDPWIALDVIIQLLRDRKWCWLIRPETKYLNIRVDTRDMHALVFAASDHDADRYLLVRSEDELREYFKRAEKENYLGDCYDDQSQGLRRREIGYPRLRACSCGGREFIYEGDAHLNQWVDIDECGDVVDLAVEELEPLQGRGTYRCKLCGEHFKDDESE